MVARDQANQGAAVLLTSVGKARALGVPEDRWVYLHGGADVKERTPIGARRPRRRPGRRSGRAAQALDARRRDARRHRRFDLYSCFPIAVFNVRDGAGPRRRTIRAA